MNSKLLFLALLTLIAWTPRIHANPTTEPQSFPFTQQENQDGAKYVWFVYGNAGFKYDYLPAKDFPKSPRFEEVQKPQPGDVAWWPGFMAIAKVADGKMTFLTAEGEHDLSDIASLYGSPRFYRYLTNEK